jgi:N-acetylglucosamine-6-phosphate deacetylase
MEIIDLHTHGLSGYDTRSSDAEHLLKIAELHGMRGTAQLVLSVYPAALPVMRASLSLIRQAMELQTAAPSDRAGDAPQPARIIGAHLEGPFLNHLKAGALNAMALLEPDERRIRELIEGYEDIIKIITVAPELDGATALIRMLANRGIRVNMGHSNATFAEAEAGFHAGAKGITHLFNAMSGIHHREPGLAGFGLMYEEVYVEVIADPFHLHPEIIRMIFALKRPDRILLVSDSVRDTHAFRQPAEVTDSRGMLLGGGLALAEAAEYLRRLGLNKDILAQSISANPERYLAP